AYQLDSTQTNGVKQLISAPSTRVITDATGTAISVAKTAQQIFDAQNPDGSDASGNVFAAVNSLLTALNNNDQAGIAQAASTLQSAGAYLNRQLAFYGEAQDRIAAATDLAQKFQTQQQGRISRRHSRPKPISPSKKTCSVISDNTGERNNKGFRREGPWAPTRATPRGI